MEALLRPSPRVGKKNTYLSEETVITASSCGTKHAILTASLKSSSLLNRYGLLAFLWLLRASVLPIFVAIFKCWKVDGNEISLQPTWNDYVIGVTKSKGKRRQLKGYRNHEIVIWKVGFLGALLASFSLIKIALSLVAVKISLVLLNCLFYIY